ncbi:hypothetical protein N182_21025 [Sinorhizobium sp. GL2]|nr:hypothetical protein N182_21025 [Sinorhizobium sp. GL2]
MPKSSAYYFWQSERLKQAVTGLTESDGYFE